MKTTMIPKTLHQRRTRLEIIHDILEVARSGVNKTRIVYKANLNFKLLDEYLAYLKRFGLVTVEQRIIKTTENGKRYTEVFKELGRILYRTEITGR